MTKINKLLFFIHKYYWFFIGVILVVSYGQTLLMLPWQDDNALFFKLAHINENAGFMGPGITGAGAYKYTAFFYYPIYLFVKFNPFYYFAFGLFLYFISTILIYKVFSKLLNVSAGKLAGFLYACGFVGSDSYIRLFNSVITSISVIAVLVVIFTYWNYCKSRSIKWYFISLLLFFIGEEFAKARTHYLIVIPILFELLYFAFKKPLLKSLSFSILRIIVFLPLFNYYVLLADNRSRGALDYIISILSGRLFNTYGFFSSFATMILPNALVKYLVPVSYPRALVGNAIFYYIILFIFLVSVLFLVYKKFSKYKKVVISFNLISLVWAIISTKVFISPLLVVSQENLFITFLGGELLLFTIYLFLYINQKYKPLYLILWSGMIANLLSYTAYNPLQAYEKINRYFSHSFIFLIGLMVICYLSFKDTKLKKITLFFIIMWGFINLGEAFLYQREIYFNRTLPVKSFYSQLLWQLPVVSKNDVLFFDLEDKMRGPFADAFSVAQMPNTTAIAWRYGVDRDDFKMYQETEDFFNYLNSKKVDPQHIFTFFYSSSGLDNTTLKFRQLLRNKETLPITSLGPKSSEVNVIKGSTNSLVTNEGVEFSNNVKIPSLMPLKLFVQVKATPLDVSELKFPFNFGLQTQKNEIYDNPSLANLSFQYKKYKNNNFGKQILVSSDWQGRVASNLNDNDYGSVWQADRILWLKEEQFIEIQAGGGESYDRLVFANGFSDHTPLEFEILVSDDKKTWNKISTFINNRRFNSGELGVVAFKETKAKYFKIHFLKTLNSDSPAIAEIWLVPSGFSSLNILKVEDFLRNPYGRVSDRNVYEELNKGSGMIGTMEVSWVNNKNFGWQHSVSTNTTIRFDGSAREYEILLPPGGTSLSKLKFSVTDFPGQFEVTPLGVEY